MHNIYQIYEKNNNGLLLVINEFIKIIGTYALFYLSNTVEKMQVLRQTWKKKSHYCCFNTLKMFGCFWSFQETQMYCVQLRFYWNNIYLMLLSVGSVGSVLFSVRVIYVIEK